LGLNDTSPTIFKLHHYPTFRRKLGEGRVRWRVGKVPGKSHGLADYFDFFADFLC
jgi:hypothetical protein